MDKKYIQGDPANAEVILSDPEQSQESRRIPQRLSHRQLAHPAEVRAKPAVRNDVQTLRNNNLRHCPQCELLTLIGMPGGRDSTCNNCGYKDPCCYD